MPLHIAPPHPLLQANPTAVGGGGGARDMDGSGADNGGTVVIGDPGAYAPTLEVLPLQQQFVAPQPKEVIERLNIALRDWKVKQCRR